jgi:hypothetical protein
MYRVVPADFIPTGWSPVVTQLQVFNLARTGVTDGSVR